MPLSIATGENPVGSGGMRVIGNVFLDSGSPCGQSNTTFSYNAFVSGACGTNSITNSLATYLGPASPAHRRPGHLQPQSRQRPREQGKPGQLPRQDRTGAPRYTGTAPDLGAYEGP